MGNLYNFIRIEYLNWNALKLLENANFNFVFVWK